MFIYFPHRGLLLWQEKDHFVVDSLGTNIFNLEDNTEIWQESDQFGCQLCIYIKYHSCTSVIIEGHHVNRKMTNLDVNLNKSNYLR